MNPVIDQWRTQLSALPPGERAELAHFLLTTRDPEDEGALNPGHERGLTEAERAEIDRRLADDDAAPDDVVSWDEVRSAALKRAGR